MPGSKRAASRATGEGMRLAVAAVLAMSLVACGGGGGSAPTPPPAPTVELTSSVPDVIAGGSAVLSWSSTNAASCAASGAWTGNRASAGTETVAPTAPGSTYTLSCTGTEGRTATAGVFISVVLPPVVTLTYGGFAASYNMPAQLDWSASGADSCVASGGWTGNRPFAGTEMTARLTTNTSFTLTCSNRAGSGTATVTVPVSQPVAPVVLLSASPATILTGASTTLSWSALSASSCEASGGWTGPRSAPLDGNNRTETVGPLSADTAFTLTCTNPFAGAQATTTVRVVVAFPPEVHISANPAYITAGSSSTLTWTTVDAASCIAGNSWGGANQPTSGSFATGPVMSSTTYSLTCTGLGGTTQGAASVVVTGPNRAPVANAGADQEIFAGTTVRLSGAQSHDDGGYVAAYAWSQSSGPAVTLSGANTVAPSFVAPSVANAATLVFSLAVTDDAGAVSAPDTVAIVVNPLPAGTVPVTGKLSFARVPATAHGLDYAATRQDPARGVTVVALDATTRAELARSHTDDSGGFALAVPPSTDVIVRAIAEMRREGAAPIWRFEVRDSDAGAAPYSYDSAAVNSGAAGVARDIAIQSGWNPATASYAGTRAAAPFAILDTIYRATQLILGVQPNAAFAPLVIDWSPANTADGGTFYSNDVGGPKITLAGEVNVDTDEYDAHVIAHEFGHYIEDQFSRSDHIGGPHAIGDKLDLRVAFGEGFGYAFGAIVLDDPLTIDTYGSQQALAGVFNIESVTGPVHGWYSEPSVWSILWDLFDSQQDDYGPGVPGDSLALGFAPLWQVLAGPQRTTEALTGIFPFVTALKAGNPAVAAAIDAVVSAQQVESATIDAFGSTETNAAGSADVLPIYTAIAIGGPPVIVRSVGTSFGTPNKLSNHRFLRFATAAPRSVRITATAPIGRDIDFVLYRRGIEVDRGEQPGDEDLTVTLAEAGTYVLDVYDCINAGCASGTPGITDLTVTLTSN